MWGFFAPLIRLSFWFDPVPPPFSPVFDAAMLWGSATFVLASLVLVLFARRFADKDLRRFLRRVASFCFWFGFVGLGFYGLNWLRVPVLSTRVLLLAWIIPFVWWAVRLARYWFRDRPKAVAASAERQAYEKWLPKPGK